MRNHRVRVALGEIIRQQRELAEMSMRQFAELAGISNPYLSQIERGLRAPSEQVLEGIAGALKVSADALYQQAGVSPPGEEPEDSAVLDAIAADPRLTARQRSCAARRSTRRSWPPRRASARRRSRLAVTGRMSDGKAALVTGAASGIGRAVATRLERDGHGRAGGRPRARPGRARDRRSRPT